MQNLNQLTKTDVEKVAQNLAQANGTTTTLEIKNQLRADGFEASQKDVSNFMLEIASDDANWDSTPSPSGNHLIYSYNKPQPNCGCDDDSCDDSCDGSCDDTDFEEEDFEDTDSEEEDFEDMDNLDDTENILNHVTPSELKEIVRYFSAAKNTLNIQTLVVNVY